MYPFAKGFATSTTRPGWMEVVERLNGTLNHLTLQILLPIIKLY